MDEKKKTVFDFEAEDPPVLTQTMLEAEQERRKLNRQTALVALAGILLEICFLLAALLLRHEYPMPAFICAAYMACSSAGGGILAVVYSAKRRELLCQEQV